MSRSYPQDRLIECDHPANVGSNPTFNGYILCHFGVSRRKHASSIAHHLQQARLTMQSVLDALEVATAAGPGRAIDRLVSVRSALVPKLAELTTVRDHRFLIDLFLQWATIAAVSVVAIWSAHWAVYVVAMLIIATRQHALGILMHDGTHYRLLSNRTLNDAICDYFCALPVGMSTSRYRHEHLLHHRYLNTDKDPYWVDFQRDDSWHWPKRPAAAIWVFIRDVTSLNGPRWGAVMRRWSPWINHFPSTRPRSGPPTLTGAERGRVYVFHAAVIGALALSPVWWQLAMLWLLPLMTVTPAMVRLRTIGEHLGIPNRSELDASRHTDGSWFEKLTVAPCNINYHLDHHLFPAVPYYNLPRLHELLLREPVYGSNAILNRRYFGFGQGMLLGQIIQGAEDSVVPVR